MARHTDSPIGERIRTRRLLLKLSIRHAADRAGLSHATWSRIEHGLQGTDNRFTIAAIADALRCSVADLTDQPATPANPDQAQTSVALHEMLQAIIAADLRYRPEGDPEPHPDLAAEVDLVTDLRAKCDYVGAARRLPDLIGTLYARAFGPHRAGALRLLVLTADTAAFVARYLGTPTSAALAAERAQQAAEALADPVMLGLAAWSRAHAATGASLYSRALLIADQAAADLRPHLDAPDAPEMYGSLLMTAAYSAFALGRDAEFASRLAEAEQLARRTGDSAALKLMFGPTNISFWKVSMEADGANPDRAVEVAARTNPQAVSRVARQATFHMDTGRALARLGRDDEAVRQLVTAERLAPQRIRHSPMAVETTRLLLERARRNATGDQLRGLAERVGVTQ